MNTTPMKNKKTTPMMMIRLTTWAWLLSCVTTTASSLKSNNKNEHHGAHSSYAGGNNNSSASSKNDAIKAWRKTISELPPLPVEPLRRLQVYSNNNRRRAMVQSALSSVLNVTSPRTIVLDYGDQHPWEQFQKQQQQQQQQQQQNQQQQPHQRRLGSITTAASTSSTYQPIRIHFVTDAVQALIGQSTALDSKISYVLNTLLPRVSTVWSSHLNVVPNTKTIPVNSSVCFGLFNGLLPSSVLNNGVPNADLVILTSMADSLTASDGSVIDFCSPGVLAVATYCEKDQWDRPIIGFINFCPSTSSSTSSSSDTSTQASSSANGGGSRRQLLSPFPAQLSLVSRDDSILVAIHEVGHVLGMSFELFPYFRDPLTGEPLTERPIATTAVQCTNNRGTKAVRLPSSKILQSGTTPNGLLYYEIVTPRVQTVVRNHFNCQSLNGARLEIQDTSATSCIGSHWDERLQYSELMSPVYSGTADDLSPLTLALMEDSGWYQVNYGGALLSPFGMGAGCDFVNGLCIVNDAVPSYGKGYFCATPTTVRSDGSVYLDDNDAVCDPNHYKMTVCALFDQSQIPSGFLSSPVDVTYFSNPNLVGKFEQASFCPMPIFPSNVDCTDSSTRKFKTYQGEQYGSNSRCINANFQDPSSGSQVIIPGCFNIQCDRENFRVVVNGIPCEYDFQQVSIKTTSSTSATMECPRLSTVCPDLFCPNDCSGRGVCQYDANSGSSSSSTQLKAPQCQCTDRNVTAADCQNGTLPPAVPIFYNSPQSSSSSSAAPSLLQHTTTTCCPLGAFVPWIATLGLMLLHTTWTSFGL